MTNDVDGEREIIGPQYTLFYNDGDDSDILDLIERTGVDYEIVPVFDSSELLKRDDYGNISKEYEGVEDIRAYLDSRL